VPIVISLDLHGILTARMLRHCNGAAIYRTYPHEDFQDTGARAARLLLSVLDGRARPVTARVRVPALVRGPELMTRTGRFGRIVEQARAAEGNGVLAAAFMIGNPFTDVPELCSQPVVVTDNDPGQAGRIACDLAAAFWAERERMQARLDDLDAAIAEARTLRGPVTFSDPADAPSSGASGDSAAILAGLVRHGYPGRALLPLVDPRAAAQAFALGVGARGTFRLGGALDPARFETVTLEATVEMLSPGSFALEQWGNPVEAGPTAVLKAGSTTIVVVSRPIFMLDRSLYLAHGQDPARFDLIVIKSPGAYMRYYGWAEKNYNLDVPGSTSANLRSLGHRVCRRPMFPLDDAVDFRPESEVFGP
jgi:microcystin degradation protein MlrC